MPNYSGGISREFLEELKAKCDIVTIISQYIPLSKKGGKYFGCCPFHNEKTASLCVNTDGQYYHCFGCGVSGNVIGFVMEMESLSYVDAVKYLADRAGMQMPELKFDPDAGKKREKHALLLDLMRDAAHYYRSNLVNENKGAEAREYLRARGISDEVSQHYGLGLSLGYDNLQGYLRRKGYSAENLRDCGLVSGNELSDAFAGRIIVPILDGMSNVIAFGGRIYRGEENVAKYKNSTNTFIFDKSKTLYGVNYIKREKRSGGGYNNLILVEGYMDVISLGAAGVKNVVAGMGTALTEWQAREIKRLVPTVYVCYDGDAAGRKAAVRNVDILAHVGLEVKIVSLPDGADPDDTVKQEGYDGFMARVKHALPVIDYKLKLCQDAYDIQTASGMAKYISAALDVLREVESMAEKEVYLGLLSRISGVSLETLRAEAKPSASASKKKEASTDKQPKNLRAVRFVLNKLVNNSGFVSYLGLSEDWFAMPVHKSIFNAVAKQKGEFKLSQFIDEATEEEAKELNVVLDSSFEFSNEAMEQSYYYDCLLSLANEYLSGKLEILKKEYAELSDPEEKRRTVAEISSLQQKLKSKNVKDKL